MIVGITDSQLNEVAYDYNTHVAKAEQTIEKLVTTWLLAKRHFQSKSRWFTFRPLQRPPTEIQAIDTSVAIIVSEV